MDCIIGLEKQAWNWEDGASAGIEELRALNLILNRYIGYNTLS